jgi:hypothetical protein
MMEATPSPPLAYLWEPLNPLHRPGICDARFPNWFTYICQDNGAAYVDSIRDMLAFRYKPRAELSAVHGPKDLARLARDWTRFRQHRARNAVPLLKDPIAVLSSEWLCDTFDMDVVVLARHPAAFAYSLQRRGWSHPFEDFLKQPLLMRDLLTPFEHEIRDFVAERRPALDQAILLWKIVYAAVEGFRNRRPNWQFVRLEDIAADPLAVFADLFVRLGLTFDDAVRTNIVRHSSSSNPALVTSPSSVSRNSAESVRTWRTGLSAADIDRVRAGVGDVAKNFYSDSDW